MNFRLVAEHWDRIGQFYATFSGDATASAALQRLNRFQFYAANRELGRALKTEFVPAVHLRAEAAGEGAAGPRAVVGRAGRTVSVAVVNPKGTPDRESTPAATVGCVTVAIAPTPRSSGPAAAPRAQRCRNGEVPREESRRPPTGRPSGSLQETLLRTEARTITVAGSPGGFLAPQPPAGHRPPPPASTGPARPRVRFLWLVRLHRERGDTMGRQTGTLALLAALGAACDSGSPTTPTVADIRADHCIDATGGEITFTTGDRYRGVDYFVDFRNLCGYALDVHSIACYTRDGVRAAGARTAGSTWSRAPVSGSTTAWAATR